MSNIGEVKFKIFKKKKGIFWTNTLIVNTVVVICFVIFIIKYQVLSIKENNTFDKLVGYAAVGIIFYGIFMKIIGIVRHKPLKGKFEGSLILERDKITINNQVYNIEDIQNIKVLNYDYYGKFKLERYDFEASLSQGVDNDLEIRLNSGKIIKCAFFQFNRNDMSAAKKNLFYYYLNNKILFFDLASILDKSETYQIEILKKELNLFREELAQKKIL